MLENKEKPQAILLMGIPASRKSSFYRETYAGLGVAHINLDTFDCRLNLQYEWDKVLDYFRWRSIDAERNSFDAYYYWLLCGDGMGAQTATEKLRLLDVAARRLLVENEDLEASLRALKKGLSESKVKEKLR